MDINLKDATVNVPFAFGDTVKDTLTGVTGTFCGLIINMGEVPMCLLHVPGKNSDFYGDRSHFPLTRIVAAAKPRPPGAVFKAGEAKRARPSRKAAA